MHPAHQPRCRRCPSASICQLSIKRFDPCVDFYAFARGNWKKDNPIPADQTRWGPVQRTARTQQLPALLRSERPPPMRRKTPLQKKYGDFFAVLLHERRPGQQARRKTRIAPALSADRPMERQKVAGHAAQRVERAALAPVLLRLRFDVQDPKKTRHQADRRGSIRQASDCRTATTT